MVTATNEALSEAYELIEANRIDEARQLLEPMLESEADNPDVWWVYAHAVDNPTDARRALRQIKELDPQYPQVDEMLAEIDELQPTAPSPTGEIGTGIKRIRPLAPGSPVAEPSYQPDTDLDDSSFDDDLDLDDDLDIEAEGKRNLVLPLALATLLGVALIVFVLWLAFRNQGSSVAPPATTQAVAQANPTETPLGLGVPQGDITAEAESAQVATETDDAVTGAIVGTDEATEAPTEPTDDAIEETIEATEDATEIIEEQTEEVVTEVDETDVTSTGNLTEPDGATSEPTEDATVQEMDDETEEAATVSAIEDIAETEETTDEPTATETSSPTDTPTQEPTVTDTPAPTLTNTPLPTTSETVSLADVFSDFTLNEARPTSVIETESGEAFLINICTEAITNRQEALNEAMTTFAESEIEPPEGTRLVGITLYQCENDEVFRSIATPIDTFFAYRDGGLNDRRFQLSWQPIQ